MGEIIQRRCEKCGRILAQSNKTNECSECKKSKKYVRESCYGAFNIMPFLVILVAVFTISALIIMYNERYPLTYEDAIVTIVDKDRYVSSNGKGTTIIRYFFIFDDGNKVNVSGETYNNHEIGDAYYVSYKIRDGQVVGISINENNNTQKWNNFTKEWD